MMDTGPEMERERERGRCEVNGRREGKNSLVSECLDVGRRVMSVLLTRLRAKVLYRNPGMELQ